MRALPFRKLFFSSFFAGASTVRNNKKVHSDFSIIKSSHEPFAVVHGT